MNACTKSKIRSCFRRKDDRKCETGFGLRFTHRYIFDCHHSEFLGVLLAFLEETTASRLTL